MTSRWQKRAVWDRSADSDLPQSAAVALTTVPPTTGVWALRTASETSSRLRLTAKVGFSWTDGTPDFITDDLWGLCGAAGESQKGGEGLWA